MNSNRDTLILGGGLAGLGAAYHSGAPVYECRDRVGGSADSYVKDGFVFDIGIHVLQSRIEYFHDLMTTIGVDFVDCKRNAWIYSFGRYAAYPFQVNTSHLPLLLKLRCVFGYLFRSNNVTPRNYEEWMKVNFGNGFATSFLIPYAEKFWRVSPKHMTFEWTGDRVPRPKVRDVLKGAVKDQDTGLGTNSIFQYPSRAGAGFSAVATALAAKIPLLFRNQRATAIDPRERFVVFNGGESKVYYDYLIATLPLPVLVKLLPDVPDTITQAVAKLAWNSIAVVNVAIGRAPLSDKHWIHFPDAEISFFRISFPENFCEGLTPPGAAAIQAEVAYDINLPPDRDKIAERVVADLKKVGVMRADDPILFTDVIYQEYGYVVYDQYRVEAVRTIHDYFHSLGIYPCGRYGAWEYLWSDEAILSGKTAVEKVLALRAEG